MFLLTVNQHFSSGSTPLTDNKFFILAFAIALSLYLAKLSKEITSEIVNDLNQERYSQAELKNRDLVLVIIGNIVFLWLLIIFPTLWMIGHWFLTLSPTSSYFTVMRWWLFIGIILGSLYMFYILIRKVFKQIDTITKAREDVKFKRNF